MLYAERAPMGRWPGPGWWEAWNLFSDGTAIGGLQTSSVGNASLTLGERRFDGVLIGLGTVTRHGPLLPRRFALRAGDTDVHSALETEEDRFAFAPPDDPALRFERGPARGFFMYILPAYLLLRAGDRSLVGRVERPSLFGSRIEAHLPSYIAVTLQVFLLWIVIQRRLYLRAE